MMAKEIIQGKLKLKLIVEYYFPKGCTDNLRPYLSSQKSIFSRSITFNADCSVVNCNNVVNCNTCRKL